MQTFQCEQDRLLTWMNFRNTHAVCSSTEAGELLCGYQNLYVTHTAQSDFHSALTSQLKTNIT